VIKTATPLVSICCIVYNHEKYIRNAMEGFLAQKTSFPIEIIIHDDASTDRTVEILQEYASKYPEQIYPIYQKRNQYSQKIKPWPNFVFPRARGSYIALCEGDDFWTDPLKLQKQVEYLEAHPEASGCFHNAKILKDEPDNELFINSEVSERDFLIDDLFADWFIPTCSMVCRRGALLNLPKWINYTIHGDLSMWLHLAKAGSLHYLPDVMGVYRKHEGGISHHHHSLQLIPSLGFVLYNFDRDNHFRFSEHICDSLLQRVESQIEKQTEGRVAGEMETVYSRARTISARIPLFTLCKAILCKFLSVSGKGNL